MDEEWCAYMNELVDAVKEVARELKRANDLKEKERVSVVRK